MAELKEIALDLIEEIANYREVEPPNEKDLDMLDLADSVRKDGIFQPILVRPHPSRKGAYQLIFGHRRRLASQMAGMRTIPATVKAVSDADVLEIQVTENMQRKDVHPMDEGLAFFSLMTAKSWSVHELASRFVKKDFYIRQRLRLTELSKPWQSVFFKGAITMTEALQVAMLSPADQKALYDDQGIEPSDLKKPGFKVELSKWDFNKFKGDLSCAPFDTTDPFLDRKMGACSSCKFNTGVALLFPDEGGARCMNTGCFKNKTEKSFALRVKVSVEDPAMLFVNADYNDHPKEIAALVKTHGIEVMQYGSFTQLDAPEKPDREEWEDMTDGDFDTEKEKKAAWEKDLDGYEDELKAYNSKIASGKFKKALVVAGERKGAYVYITIGKKSTGGSSSGGGKKTAAEVKEAVQAGKATLTDIRGEISRIEESLSKARELDEEKVHIRIMEDYKKLAGDEDEPRITTALTNDEWICLHWFLLEKARVLDCGHSELEKLLCLQDVAMDDRDTRGQAWQQIAQMDAKQLATVFRILMIGEYAGQSPRGYNTDKAFVMRKMAESMPGIPIAEYEAEQQEKADKRHKIADKRLAELRAKEGELVEKKAKKTAGKIDPAPKKSAAKKTAKPKGPKPKPSDFAGDDSDDDEKTVFEFHDDDPLGLDDDN